jgi:SAM-dependent methyltransferase
VNIVRALWFAAESVAWDWAVGLVEMCQYGNKGWWWHLHWEAYRRYFPRSAARVSLQQSPGLAWPVLQFTYGETPYVSFLHMLRQTKIEPGGLVVDLGCGRGAHLLAAALALGVRCRGYDLVSTFIERGQLMAQAMGVHDRVHYIEQDILEAPIEDADVVHVVATTFVPKVKNRLLPRLEALRPGTMVMTHAWRLPAPRFKLEGNKDYPTTWGWSTIYFYRVAAESVVPPADSATTTPAVPDGSG